MGNGMVDNYVIYLEPENENEEKFADGVTPQRAWGVARLIIGRNKRAMISAMKGE